MNLTQIKRLRQLIADGRRKLTEMEHLLNDMIKAQEDHNEN